MCEIRISIVAAIYLLLGLISFGFAGLALGEEEIDLVLAHPLFRLAYSCSEHATDQLPYLGDNLGTDCTILQMVEQDGRAWFGYHVNDGLRNEDWFSWGEDVLAPCDCEVSQIIINPDTNQPGVLGKPPASYVVLKQSDGIHFLIAHIRNPVVSIGDTVSSGQKIAIVGNNGFSRNPHIHMGAWIGESPLQIRFDLAKKRDLQNGQ